MYHASRKHSAGQTNVSDNRQHERLDLRCPVRIRIGNRQYAGYLENISEGGAKVRTLTPINGIGKVQLTLPGLGPMEGSLRWISSGEVGLGFTLQKHALTVAGWMRSRLDDGAPK